MTTLPSEKHQFLGKIVLKLLEKDEKFKSKLQSAFPAIYADLQSAATNPNCSCRGKVERHIIDNKQASLEIVNKYLEKNSKDKSIEDIINIDYQALMPKPYAGRMFKISNTEEDYKQFIREITKDRASFRTMSTSISGKTLYIYFA